MALELKYRRGSWGDGELCALFRTKLLGRALSLYEALFREIRKGGHDTLANATEKACQAERFTENMLVFEELKKLQARRAVSCGVLCRAREAHTTRVSAVG